MYSETTGHNSIVTSFPLYSIIIKMHAEESHWIIIFIVAVLPGMIHVIDALYLVVHTVVFDKRRCTCVLVVMGPDLELGT